MNPIVTQKHPCFDGSPSLSNMAAGQQSGGTMQPGPLRGSPVAQLLVVSGDKLEFWCGGCCKAATSLPPQANVFPKLVHCPGPPGENTDDVPFCHAEWVVHVGDLVVVEVDQGLGRGTKAGRDGSEGLARPHHVLVREAVALAGGPEVRALPAVE